MTLPYTNIDYSFFNNQPLQFGEEVPSLERCLQGNSHFSDQFQYTDDMSHYSSDSKSSVETDLFANFDFENVFNPASINGTLPMMTLTNLNTNETLVDNFSGEFTDISEYNQNNTFSQQPSPSQQSLWSCSESTTSSGHMQDVLFSDDNLGIESAADLEFSDDDELNEDDAHNLENIVPTFEPVLTKQEKPDGNMAWDQAPSPPPPVYKSNFNTTNNTTSIQVQRHRGTKQPILYLVLFHALEHPKDYGDLIYWINKSKGIFEFSSRNKEFLARAWGIVKNNRCKMTYQKMSRALRIYIKKNIVLTKMKRKLQYVFRPEVLMKLRQRQQAGAIVSSDIAETMYKESRHQRNC